MLLKMYSFKRYASFSFYILTDDFEVLEISLATCNIFFRLLQTGFCSENYMSIIIFHYNSEESFSPIFYLYILQHKSGLNLFILDLCIIFLKKFVISL